MNKWAKLRKNVKLKEHQKRVEDKLSKSDALLLFHGLGSGKTLSAINAIGDEPTDFIVPASLRENAKKELRKFTTSNKANVRSYNSILNTPPSGNIVLDEAHRIGNAATKTTSALLDNAHNYKKRILLTGSPIRNHPYELGPLMRILGIEDVPVDKKTFEERFVERTKVSPGFWASIRGVKPGEKISIKNRDTLKRMLEGKVDYHKETSKDFPTVTEETVQVQMDPDQEKLYKKSLSGIPNSVRYKIKTGIPLSATERLHLNSYLNASRQVSNSTARFGLDKPTAKIRRMRDDILHTIKDNKGKTVTYSNFLRSGVEALASELEKAKVPYAIFNGKLSDKKRKQIVEDYNKGKIKSLLLSGAGSEGLDLKGTRLMQIMEPHWNEARTDQVKGRAIRYKSHSHLPERDRHVLVRNYMSTRPDTFFGLKKADKAVDEFLKELGSEKSKLNKSFLDILKEVGSKN